MVAFFFWVLVVVVGSSALPIVDAVRGAKKLPCFFHTQGGKALQVVLVILAVLSPFYYEFPNPPFSDVVTFKNGEIVRHPLGTFTLGREFAVSPREIDLSHTVTVITENPKARRFQYRVVGTIVDPEKFYRKTERRLHWATGEEGRESNGAYRANRLHEKVTPASLPLWKESVGREVAKVIASALYGFNDHHSKDLARFFNPLDPAEQAEFGKLVEEYVNPVTAEEGVAVSFSEFAIE